MTNDIKIVNLVLFKTKTKIFIVFNVGISMDTVCHIVNVSSSEDAKKNSERNKIFAFLVIALLE